jgi:hypothetical protein
MIAVVMSANDTIARCTIHRTAESQQSDALTLAGYSQHRSQLPACVTAHAEAPNSRAVLTGVTTIERTVVALAAAVQRQCPLPAVSLLQLPPLPHAHLTPTLAVQALTPAHWQTWCYAPQTHMAVRHL